MTGTGRTGADQLGAVAWVVIAQAPLHLLPQGQFCPSLCRCHPLKAFRRLHFPGDRQQGLGLGPAASVQQLHPRFQAPVSQSDHKKPKALHNSVPVATHDATGRHHSTSGAWQPYPVASFYVVVNDRTTSTAMMARAPRMTTSPWWGPLPLTAA